jgi:hypothetical protein
MIIPIDEQVPDLSSLKPNLVRMALRRLFQSAGPTDHTTYALSMNTIRLGDLCVDEYQNARAAILDWHSKRTNSGLSYVARASGHFEACIWAIERMLRHVKVLRSALFVPPAIKQLLPKSLLLLRGDQEKMLIDIRDAVTHFEGLLLQGEIPEGSSLAVVANGGNLEIGDLRVSIKRLADWIRELHGCAERLADYGGDASPVV